MKKNILKKVIVLMYLGFVLSGSNFVFAEDPGVDPVIPPVNQDPVVIVPADISIHLKITSSGSSLYDQDISVKACDSDNNPITPPTVSAYCAVLQSGLPSVWDWSWPPGAFVTSINNILGFTSKDKDGNNVYHYWSWSSNSNPGMTGLNEYNLKLNDSISLDFIDPVELVTVPVITTPVSSGGGSKGGTMITVTEKTFSVAKALDFLLENQNKDGSFNSPVYTDWAAIAAVASENKLLEENITNYFKLNKFESNVLTDNERHAMALMSLNINPYNGTVINYIKKIVESFDGKQFGDNTQDNDDVFALIVLKNAGYNANDEIIIKDINYLISKQEKDGSMMGSIDMTAASLQAFSGLENISGVKELIFKAKNYLLSKQGVDNGFGDSFATSWVLQSLFIENNISKGELYLASKQQTDGGLESTTDNINTRIWATSYSIPAILHKPWSEILNNFPKITMNNNSELENKTIAQKEIIKSRGINNIVLNPKEELTIKSDIIAEKVRPSLKSNLWTSVKSSLSWLLVKLGF